MRGLALAALGCACAALAAPGGIITPFSAARAGDPVPAGWRTLALPKIPVPEMALVADGALWIEANYSETDLTHVRTGQPVTVRIDTYPGHDWRGVVESLSPATGAEFAIIPPQNATGNWVKVAQRVPVRIRLEPAPDAPPLRAGLSAHVSIDTGHRRRLAGLSW